MNVGKVGMVPETKTPMVIQVVLLSLNVSWVEPIVILMQLVLILMDLDFSDVSATPVGMVMVSPAKTMTNASGRYQNIKYRSLIHSF